MNKLLFLLLRAIGFGIVGGLAGVIVGMPLYYIIGWLVTGSAGNASEGAFIGGWIGAFTGVALCEPSEEWSNLLDWLAARCLPPRPFSRRTPSIEAQSRSGSASPQERVESAKPVVLFLCTRNSARSQIAEAYLKHYGQDRFVVYSAGAKPGQVHPLTVRVMKEAGIDISGQHAKDMRQFLGRLSVRIAITVCEPVEPLCPMQWPGAFAHLTWPFIDPAAGNGPEDVQLIRFRTVRDQIESQVQNWLEQVKRSNAGN